MDDIEVFKNIFPEKYFYEFWLKDKRPDNRNFNEMRKTTITRSGSAGFILSCGNNVVQSTYEIQQVKVKINTDTDSSSKRLYEKIVIRFAQEPLFPLFDVYIHHLKKLFVKRYERHLSGLKLHEQILIDISALFHDISLLNSVLLSTMISLYECLIHKLNVEITSIDMLFPIIIKGFYIPEKEAVLLLSDPNKEEFMLNPIPKRNSTFLVFCNLTDNTHSLEKIEGMDISFDDLVNLAEILKNNSGYTELKNNITSYMKDVSTRELRLI